MTTNSTTPILTMYGIKNCDTIKKARNYLTANHINYQFHDYRADGLDAELLSTLIASAGWEALLNKRGTTWRKLDEAVRDSITDAASAQALMLEMPAMIKRPLLQAADGSVLLGFNEATYQQFIQEKC